MIRFTQTSPPDVEPVSLAEAKEQAKIEIGYDDGKVTALIVAARRKAETVLGRSLITQEWRANLRKWPDALEGETMRRVRLAHFPVQSIDAVTVDGVALAADSYRLDDKELLVSGSAANSLGGVADAGIVIEFTAGYGDAADDVPDEIRLAVMMLVTHFYEARGATSPQGIYHQIIPMGVDTLLQPHKILEL